jgi:hypothetical protein
MRVPFEITAMGHCVVARQQVQEAMKLMVRAGEPRLTHAQVQAFRDELLALIHLAGEVEQRLTMVQQSEAHAGARSSCHVWPLLAVLALSPVSQGWVMILTVGLGIFLTLAILFDATRVWQERKAQSQQSTVNGQQGCARVKDASPGAMSDVRREAVLADLLWQWQQGEPAFTEEYLVERCLLTKAQAVAFMHWARGQVVTPNKRTFRCLVEPGIDTRYLHFRAVTGEVPGFESQGSGSNTSTPEVRS